MTYASPEAVLNAQYNAALAAQQPNVLHRPKLFADGDKWCALYGDDIQIGVCGFGDIPADAMQAFDAAWQSDMTPDATRFTLNAKGRTP